jgi:hypothetical protein
MKTLILYVIVLGLYYLLGSPYYYQFIYNMKPKISGPTIVALTGVVFAALIVLIASFTYNQKENFFFEVTKDRPRCSKILSGRPIGFEFTSDNDRFCYCNQPIQNPQQWGWDGYLAATVKQDCQTGGCVLPGQPTQPQDASGKL